MKNLKFSWLKCCFCKECWCQSETAVQLPEISSSNSLKIHVSSYYALAFDLWFEENVQNMDNEPRCVILILFFFCLVQSEGWMRLAECGTCGQGAVLFSWRDI